MRAALELEPWYCFYTSKLLEIDSKTIMLLMWNYFRFFFFVKPCFFDGDYNAQLCTPAVGVRGARSYAFWSRRRILKRMVIRALFAVVQFLNSIDPI